MQKIARQLQFFMFPTEEYRPEHGQL